MRIAVRTVVTLALIGAALILHAFLEARALPVVRRATIALPHWPAGAPPIRVALLADLHTGTAAASVERLGDIVHQVNALRPDMVLVAGDFLPGHEPLPPTRVAELVAPLAKLRSPLGVIAVPGNHDHWAGERTLRPALERVGVLLLINRAIARGPLAIGGIDDDYTRHANVTRVASMLRATPGATVILSHSPDVIPALPADAPLLLAGHTHCGQIVLPWWGVLARSSRLPRYDCGMVRDPGRLTIVTAGIGTSVVPFRLGAPPDLWLLTLGPAAAAT